MKRDELVLELETLAEKLAHRTGMNDQEGEVDEVQVSLVNLAERVENEDLEG